MYKFYIKKWLTEGKEDAGYRMRDTGYRMKYSGVKSRLHRSRILVESNVVNPKFNRQSKILM